MISPFFIERPVLANVLALVMILIGAVALLQLPVAQYPNVVPPTVQVTTRYPGASAQTLIDTVALPIEQQVNGVQNMLYMQSTSASDGTYALTVTFAIGTDPDQAQVLVQNRVSAAMSSLPQSRAGAGRHARRRSSTAVLKFVTLISPDGRYDSLFLSNYAVINLQNELARLPGVGNVNVFGAGQYAMRIWLNPDLLQSRGLTPGDVIGGDPAAEPGGGGGRDRRAARAGRAGLPVHAQRQRAPQRRAATSRTSSSRSTQQNGGADHPPARRRPRRARRPDLQPDFLAGRPPGDRNRASSNCRRPMRSRSRRQSTTRWPRSPRAFPRASNIRCPFDTTKFVKASIDEVYMTLVEAGVLVLIVILVFLQDWRATLVPATTVPVTIIGAFAAMAALGFTVNLSTLVRHRARDRHRGRRRDRHRRGRRPPYRDRHAREPAAEKAMDELFGPVIGITLVLMAVFIPAAFLPGLTGQLYRQFALVIAATAFISAINAMTLEADPMRAVAAPACAAGEAQLLLSRLQHCL